MAWFDIIFNSSLIIRILAIGAELSFAGLIAFSMLKINEDFPDPKLSNMSKGASFLISRSPYLLMACLAVAQFFATGGVITKSQTLFAIEESLWSLGFLIVLPLAIIQLRRLFTTKYNESPKQMFYVRLSSSIIALWCIGYVCYGLFFHLPFESWAGALNQIETGLPIIKTGYQAFIDALTIVNESKRLADWGTGFLFWHSSYFTVCVWISLLLMNGPRSGNSKR